MRTLDFKNRETPSVKIVLTDGEVILTRRLVLPAEATEFDKTTKAIYADFAKTKIDGLELAYRIIEHHCQDFDRKTFEGLDVFYLKEVASALHELFILDTADEKKSE